MFKVGDKVMVVGGSCNHLGKIGVISSIDFDYCYPYGVSGDDFNYCFDDTEIILMEAARD